MSNWNLKIKIFADGADINSMLEMKKKEYIQGFTTNPTLMKKAGITDYIAFAKEVLKEIPNHPISFEVFADDFENMYRQANEISSWGENVYVKIPIMNTKKEYSYELIQKLTADKVKLNVTAIFTDDQIDKTIESLAGTTGAVVSIFAGRIADTGIDPMPIMERAVSKAAHDDKIDILWASPRELLNVFQADQAGCHIITATPDILKKLSNVGKDLEQFSLETVEMFYKDATAAGFNL